MRQSITATRLCDRCNKRCLRVTVKRSEFDRIRSRTRQVGRYTVTKHYVFWHCVVCCSTTIWLPSASTKQGRRTNNWRIRRITMTTRAFRDFNITEMTYSIKKKAPLKTLADENYYGLSPDSRNTVVNRHHWHRPAKILWTSRLQITCQNLISVLPTNRSAPFYAFWEGKI